MKIQRIWLLIAAVMAISVSLAAQDSTTPKPSPGIITGTVTDVNGDILSGATVALLGSDHVELQKALSDDNGFFEFKQLDPGTYRVAITAQGFADWASPDSVLTPGQYLILSDCKLQIAAAKATINVTDNPQEVATEEVKVEESQRVLGIIPNFYVVYDPHPAPLTTRLKFHLAMKTSTDAVTILGVAGYAGLNQAGDTPAYGQGVKGYGERFGVAAADGFADIMIGGAILPSLLHQDPRYYYQGTGTMKSRAFHALSSPFICRGDNGRLQPNYSSVGGDLGSSALANLYYPEVDRGVGLTLQNVAITTGERMFSAFVQEFVLNRLTSRARFKE